MEKIEKEKTLLTSIKKFKVPWKEFLSPNLLFLIVWIFFLLYSFLWSPEGTETYGFSNFALSDVGPIAFSLFNLVGVMALLYAATLFLESRERFVPAWIFVLGSFALGMYFLMPYFAFRGVWKKEPKTEESLFAKIVDSRILGIIIALLSFGLLFYGIIAGSLIGDWSNFGYFFIFSRRNNVLALNRWPLTLYTIPMSFICAFDAL